MSSREELRIDRDWGDEIKWDDKSETILSISQYLDEVGSRDSFEDYLNERQAVYPVVDYYASNGSWRVADPDNLPDGVIDEVHDRVPNTEPNNCYYNTQTGLYPDVTYVEGYAVHQGLPAVVPHAWFEYDGAVVEITPSVDQRECAYFGVEFESSVVRDAMTVRGQADPIVERVLGSGDE